MKISHKGKVGASKKNLVNERNELQMEENMKINDTLDISNNR